MVRIAEYIIFEEVSADGFYQLDGMLPEQYTDYIESLKSFLPQHPFLQNLISNEAFEFTGPAFRDYVLAFILSKIDYVDLAFEYFSDRSLTARFPSQLLFDFYVEFSGAEMTGKIFPLLYDSYKAKETMDKFVTIDISSIGSEKYAVFRLKDLTFSDKTEDSELYISGDDAIYISRLANGNIDVDSAVCIGDQKNTSRIYNSAIIATQIYLNTSHICIEARKPAKCLVVSENNIVNRCECPPKFDIHTDKPDLVKISIPNINNYYKLRPYRYDFESLDEDDYLQFCMFVKRIMNCLRKHRKDVLAKDKEFIDNELISMSKFKRKVMDFLIYKEIIYIDSEQPYLYKLDVECLAAYELSWVDFTQDNSGKLYDLYVEFSKYN